MKTNYKRRLRIAYTHSYDWRIPIVFCIMGPPWVVEHFRWCIPGMYPSVAVIGHDWREFGKLPMYEFGYWREDLVASRDQRTIRAGGELSFDPKQYPPGPKRRAIKLPKPKSIKPRFSIPSAGDERDWIRRRSEGEE